jgi:CYTH domain-containing protein
MGLNYSLQENIMSTKEIERKYLVDKKELMQYLRRKRISHKFDSIIQGYLFNYKGYSLRVRYSSRGSKLTYKGSLRGCTRTEREWKLPTQAAIPLLCFCRKTIHKIRYTVRLFNEVWEFDIFNNLTRDLVLAEIEIPSESHYFQKPSWVGEEVTYNLEYYNTNLIKEVI